MENHIETMVEAFMLYVAQNHTNFTMCAIIFAYNELSETQKLS